MRKVLSFIFILCAATAVAAAPDPLGTAAFSRVPVGARAPALGGGITAADGESTAILANPASLAGLAFPLTACTSTGLLPFGQSQFFLGIAGWALPELAVGFGAVYYGAGSDLEARRANTIEPDEMQSMLSQEYALGVAGSLFTALDIGLNFKILLDQLGEYDAFGTSADFGAVYRPFPRVSTALAVQDFLGEPVGGTMDWSTDATDIIESSLRLGGALDLNPVLLVAEIRGVWGAWSRVSFGAEWDVYPAFTARAGVDDGRMGLGFGARMVTRRHHEFRLDYALVQGALGGTDFEHRFTITANLSRWNWPMGQLLLPTEEPGPAERSRVRLRPNPLFILP